MAARPLEAPRALPAAFHAMASAITGRARPPLFTTGPATRGALAAAGALGATTGTVVHLPAVPTAAPSAAAVLAHELTHTRNPVRRPRFLLGGGSSLLDDDERQALAAGRDRLGQASTTGAGIVDSLPVGGGLGAVGDVATRAARAAVLEASASPMGSAFPGLAAGAGSGTAAAVGSAGSAAVGSAPAAADSAVGEASQPEAAGSGALGSASGSAAGGPAKAALDPDQIMEIVEQRLLREIERRGGRWAGVF